MPKAFAPVGFPASLKPLWAEVGAQIGMFLERLACLVYWLSVRLRSLGGAKP